MDADASEATNGTLPEGVAITASLEQDRGTPSVVNNEVTMSESENQDKTTTLPSSSGPAYRLDMIMSGHTRSVSALKFSPDGTILASAGELHLLEAIPRSDGTTTQASCG